MEATKSWNISAVLYFEKSAGIRSKWIMNLFLRWYGMILYTWARKKKKKPTFWRCGGELFCFLLSTQFGTPLPPCGGALTVYSYACVCVCMCVFHPPTFLYLVFWFTEVNLILYLGWASIVLNTRTSQIFFFNHYTHS